MTIAEQIRDFRNRKGLTLAEVAKQTGMSIETLRDIETGKIDVTVPIVNQILEAMHAELCVREIDIAEQSVSIQSSATSKYVSAKTTSVIVTDENEIKQEKLGTFDKMLMEFARHSRPTESYVHRSWWSGEMVSDVKEGDVLTIYYVGVLVVTALSYWIGMTMVEHGATFAEFCLLFGLLFGAWTGTMLWVNHKVNVFKKRALKSKNAKK